MSDLILSRARIVTRSPSSTGGSSIGCGGAPAHRKMLRDKRLRHAPQIQGIPFISRAAVRGDHLTSRRNRWALDVDTTLREHSIRESQLRYAAGKRSTSGSSSRVHRPLAICATRFHRELDSRDRLRRPPLAGLANEMVSHWSWHCRSARPATRGALTSTSYLRGD